MDFLFVNTEELSALAGLPYIQRLTYLLGIRPYMDRKSFVVGIKRRISYQSLSEVLYVEPHPGIQSGSPSRQQVRRAIKSLERAGLIQIQSSDKHLVLKCLLANTDISVINKPDTKPTHHPDTGSNTENTSPSTKNTPTIKNTDTVDLSKADIPHNSEENNMCVLAHFEKFWDLYPKKSTKQKALEAFKALNPDDALLTCIFKALQQQIHATEVLQAQGDWVPTWKFPANWLAQHCWEDEININKPMEKKHEKDSRPRLSCTTVDSFWESCKAGAQPSTGNHVIQGRVLR
jgi:hypothetical protein